MQTYNERTNAIATRIRALLKYDADLIDVSCDDIDNSIIVVLRECDDDDNDLMLIVQ